jgi:hypothetical protein
MLLPAVLMAALLQATAAPTPLGKPPLTPRHEANFGAESKQADELFADHKPLEALPLYEDLCRQDPTIALFAERHAEGLFAKEATIQNDPNARLQIHLQGIRELRRAVALGDSSVHVRTMLDLDSKTLTGAVMAGIPITVGYSYQGNAQAQAPYQEGNAAFERHEFLNAAAFFKQA